MNQNRFSQRESYQPSVGYRFLPFQFMQFDTDRKILVNEVGEYLFLENSVFEDFVGRTLNSSSNAYLDLKGRHFLFDSSAAAPFELLATKYRTKRAFLAGFTKLHIFVVSLRCEHSCHYCQVSRVSADRTLYDMSAETARRALDLVFRSPAPNLKIEFQGGEPLLNYERIVQIVNEARDRAHVTGRQVQFVITTNLALATDEILTFCHDNNVVLSTSLDGPAFIHNKNRPRSGNNSYELTLQNLQRAREILGFDQIAAIMTTTRLSLLHPREIVDEYVSQGFQSIFLRALSPYGFAVKTVKSIGYSTDEFLTFYKAALDYIIELNLNGTHLVETYAQILLTRILTPFTTGYVDLQSPSGAGIGVAVYNYDGDVYASDESRMLAEMGDLQFKLGNVHSDSYADIFGGELVRSIVTSSCVESMPGCTDCAFQSFCGADPIFNYATQGDMVGHTPTSDFHKKNFFIIKYLLTRYEADPEIRKLFWAWVHNTPLNQFQPHEVTA
ncbi:MAG TPA: His-Xaa-Ser system radical SAM maturase HxsB [Pyrinomonadaceae bacterium]|nr:His-Xaa-Ser system radical SAM maturase HxsB [Pyrinomonadaceae bacterium]